ncbi:MAG: hypothetical protein RLY78_1110 [Pseudomonadota bacterium]
MRHGGPGEGSAVRSGSCAVLDRDCPGGRPSGVLSGRPVRAHRGPAVMSGDAAAVLTACDPAFVLEAECGLVLSIEARSRVEPREAWRWLAMRIARQPYDLRAHAQRVRLLAETGEGSRLFGALVDLFLVLGDKGRELRGALLALARPALDPDDHAWLQSHLAAGLPRETGLPFALGSVVAHGAYGSGPLVSGQAVAAAPVAEPPAGDPYADDPFYVPPELKA